MGQAEAAFRLAVVVYIKYCMLFSMGDRTKGVEFRGTSLADLRAFPVTARRRAGYQIDRLQQGCDPDDWKPMTTIGPGVREIRIRDEDGAFRVIYVARLADMIFVLHCFQKKSQKTAREDIGLATRRFKDLMREIG